jgi:transposase InsO family protein
MSHQSDSITKIRICWSLYQNGISPEEIPRQIGKNRATVYRWIKAIKIKGVRKFIRDYKKAKKGRKQPRKTDPLIKAHVFEIRKRYHNCCGEKIKYFLKKHYGEEVSVATIYRILKERYQLRSKWKKYSKRGYVKKGERPRDSIQVDTVDFGGIFAFTAIDTFTREASVVLKEKLTAEKGKEALKKQLFFFGKINHIQRDGGSEFKDKWQEYAKNNIPSIRTARPYKKNEQAFIERFNGILRKECLGHLKYKTRDLPDIQARVDRFLDYYHNERPHLSLNMKTPKEFAMSHLT